MGCSHCKSTDEQLLDDFFNSLKIKDEETTIEELKTQIIKIMTTPEISEESKISVIQKKFFSSNDSRFEKTQIFYDFYKKKKDLVKDKFSLLEILWMLVLLLNTNRDDNSRIKSYSIEVLKLFGFSEEEIERNNYYLKSERLINMVDYYIEFVSDFALNDLCENREVIKRPREVYDRLGLYFSEENRNSYIRKFFFGNKDYTNFTHFIYLIDELKESNVRYSLIENKMKDEDKAEYKKNKDSLSKMNDGIQIII